MPALVLLVLALVAFILRAVGLQQLGPVNTAGLGLALVVLAMILDRVATVRTVRNP